MKKIILSSVCNMNKIKNLKEKIIICIITIALLKIGNLFNLYCPFLQLTGIECLGCGMTRALTSAIHFDYAAAFEYHRMFWSLPIIGLYALFDGKLFKNRLLNSGIISIIGIGFICNWILNLIN